MKNVIVKYSLATILVTSNVFSSGIPVVDAAANAQMMQQNIKQISEWAKEAQRWVETTTQYAKDLQAQADELATKSGVRDIVQFMKESKDIYEEARALGKTIGEIDFKEDPKNFLISKVKELIDKSFDYSCEDISYNDKIKNICWQHRIKTLRDIQRYREVGENISEHTKAINRLIGDLKKSKDIKASADINNAIQAKVALMQAEKIQIDLYRDTQIKNKEVIIERQREQSIKTFNTALPENFLEGR